ncbi:MAG: HicA protein [Desulfobacterium sp.]|nr:HicA protein [Desulfobacterium sp.]
MNKKHKKTVNRVFEKPTRSDISYIEINSLLLSLDAKIKEGQGSRVKYIVNDKILSIHKPHPQKELKKYAVELVREFLENIGVTP